MKHLSPPLKGCLVSLATLTSALVCGVAPWIQGPGMVLAGLTPDWPLIWVVCWSISRPIPQGAVAGIAMGLIQDGLTQAQPTHALELATVGILTAALQKQRFMKEDFISVALIVFGMVVVAETVMALQWSLVTLTTPAQVDLMEGATSRSLQSIWLNHQRTILSSAILSSLWAPALYLPLRSCWRYLDPGN